ncbi:MAG: hypothetical protein WA823_20170, partial [Candidatus Acidiferrales bacterium]
PSEPFRAGHFYIGRSTFCKMPHHFREWEHEPEPQSSGSRRGSPPRKRIGVAILDPSVPPRKEPRPSKPIPIALVVRVATILVLVGIAAAALFTLLAPFLKF